MDPKPRRRRRKRDYIAPVLALVSILFAMWAYSRREKSHLEPTNANELRSSLLQELPKDTRLTDAQRKMQERGFQCMTLTHSVFQGQGPFDYLYCDRAGSGGTRWMVALVTANGGVQDVLVESSVAGK